MLTCRTCGDNYNVERARERTSRYCSYACAAQGRRKSAADRKARPVVAIPGHPLMPRHGRAREHRVILYDKIGPGPHACHWCGQSVAWMPRIQRGCLIVDHVDRDERNNDPSNLAPACIGCNVHRHRKVGIGELFVETKGRGDIPRRVRAAECRCERCGTTFLAVLARLKRGPVRFCSRECRNRRAGIGDHHG